MLRSGRSRVLLLLGLLTLILAGAAVFRLYTTRTTYLLARGQAALERGDWDEAARLTKILEQKHPPSASRLFRGKTWTYAGRAASQSDGAAPHGGTVSDPRYGTVANRAITGAPEETRARDAFRNALRELTRLRDGGPLGLEGTVLGAECLVRLGERRLAAEALTTVLHRQPDSRDAHRLLAAIYIDLNSPFDAIEQLREWARLDPDTGRPYRWIGFFYKDYLHPAEAVEAYREACRRELGPADREAVLKELAETLIEGQANYQAALDMLAQGPEAFRDRPDIRVLRAQCLWALSQSAEAVALVDSALQQDPDNPRAVLWRAKVFLADQQPQLALPLLERAVRLDASDLESQQYLMQAYGLLGNRQRAEQQRQQVDKLKGYKDQLTQLQEQARRDRWDDRVRCRIAELCVRIQRPAEARMWLQAALASNPNNARAKQMLDRVVIGR